MHHRTGPRLTILTLGLLLALSGLAAAQQRRDLLLPERQQALVERARFQYLAGRRARATRPAPGEACPIAPPLIPLPPVRQHSKAACGPATLQSIAAYYDAASKRGSQLTRLSRQTYAGGADERDLKRAAQQLGLKVRMRYNWTLGELFSTVQRGVPVAVGYQAWTADPEHVNWRKAVDDGHYSAVIGFGDWSGNLYPDFAAMRRDLDHAVVWLMDPATNLGKRGWIPVREFMQRWHWPDASGKQRPHFGMTLKCDGVPTNKCFVTGTDRIR